MTAPQQITCAYNIRFLSKAFEAISTVHIVLKVYIVFNNELMRGPNLYSA